MLLHRKMIAAALQQFQVSSDTALVARPPLPPQSVTSPTRLHAPGFSSRSALGALSESTSCQLFAVAKPKPELSHTRGTDITPRFSFRSFFTPDRDRSLGRSTRACRREQKKNTAHSRFRDFLVPGCIPHLTLDPSRDFTCCQSFTSTALRSATPAQPATPQNTKIPMVCTPCAAMTCAPGVSHRQYIGATASSVRQRRSLVVRRGTQ